MAQQPAVTTFLSVLSPTYLRSIFSTPPRIRKMQNKETWPSSSYNEPHEDHASINYAQCSFKYPLLLFLSSPLFFQSELFRTLNQLYVYISIIVPKNKQRFPERIKQKGNRSRSNFYKFFLGIKVKEYKAKNICKNFWMNVTKFCELY